MQIGQHAHLGGAGIDHDDFGTFFLCAHDARTNQWMSFAGVRSGDKDTVGVFKLGDRVCHRTTSEGGDQTGHRGAVSKPGAVIDVVRSEHDAGKFLQQVILFICALGGGENANCICSGFRFDPFEFLGDQI